MALEKCPHMTACCPHYSTACNDEESKECHYIKRTTASTTIAAASLHALGVKKLSRKQIKQVETFLKEMDVHLLEE